MFSNGQAVPTILILGLLLFLLAFHLSLSEIKSKVIQGVRKTSKAIYKDYEEREKELAEVNFVRMHAYNLSENFNSSKCGNNELEYYNNTLYNRTSIERKGRIKLSLNVSNSSGKWLVNVTILDLRASKRHILEVPSPCR